MDEIVAQGASPGHGAAADANQDGKVTRSEKAAYIEAQAGDDVSNTKASVQRLIVDTDCGVDDAQALMLAFAHVGVPLQPLSHEDRYCSSGIPVLGKGRDGEGTARARAPGAIVQ